MGHRSGLVFFDVFYHIKKMDSVVWSHLDPGQIIGAMHVCLSRTLPPWIMLGINRRNDGVARDGYWSIRNTV